MPRQKIVPPFTAETAVQKVRGVEDAWNSHDANRLLPMYSADGHWRNRAGFIAGRDRIHAFRLRQRGHELDYRLIKETWAFRDNAIAVRFAYQRPDDGGQWYRSYGTEKWQFDAGTCARCDTPESATCRSRKSTGCIAGRADAGPMTIRVPDSRCTSAMPPSRAAATVQVTGIKRSATY